MKTALLAITLLAACLGPGHPAIAQETTPTPRSLTWEQLARQAGLAGHLQAKTPDEFKVDALLANATQVLCVRAKIELTATEWAQLTESNGLSNLGFFSYWSDGKIGYPWRDLIRYFPIPNSQGKVDLSKIPRQCQHISLQNEEADEYRLYLLAPTEDGKAGSLFYLYHAQRMKSASANSEPPAR